MLRRRLGMLFTAFTLTTMLFVKHKRQKLAENLAIDTTQRLDASPAHRSLHLILPATQPNEYLCQTLLTVATTGYPEPVLVKWGGDFNDREGMMMKVTRSLAYLDTLPQTCDEDLVVIADAYDVWFLLRPEILIQRYFEVIAEADERLKTDGILGSTYGHREIKNNVVFAADRSCWPVVDSQRPACGEIPEPPEPDEAVQEDYVYARWLNAGILIGPVSDVKRVLRAAALLSTNAYAPDFRWRQDDQLCLADAWAEQERARSSRRENQSFKMHTVSGATIDPTSVLAAAGIAELGITIDYRARLAQTTYGNDKDLAWVRLEASSEHYGLHIPDDVRRSHPPFERVFEGPSSWVNTTTCTNNATREVFPLLHITLPKDLRRTWWPYLWFHPYGPLFLTSNKRSPPDFGVSHGTSWRAAVPFQRESNVINGVAWSDKGEHLTWSKLCRKYEAALFTNYTVLAH